MGELARTYPRHTQGRNNPDGTVSIFCRQCGREIIRQERPVIRSISQCAICVLKAQGVTDAEEHVLAQYNYYDPTQPPVPYNAEMDAGILMLMPDEKEERIGFTPSVGGIVGTFKSAFRAIGFAMKEIIKRETPEEPVSQSVAQAKKGTGLYGPAK